MSQQVQPVSNPLDHFSLVADAVGATLIDNIINIPSKRGHGIVKKIADGSGLTMTTWNVCLQNALHLKRVIAESHGQRNFSIFFILTPGHLAITSCGIDCIPNVDTKTILLVSNDVELVFTILPQLPVRFVEIDLTGYWLAKEYSNSNQSSSPFLTSIVTQDNPVLLNEPVPLSSFHCIMDLYKNLATGHTDQFYIRAKILSLLSDIFRQPFTQKEPSSEINLQIRERMHEVERLLEDCIYKALPSISSIARQMALSESTLKRNFKEIYGVSIYEYYLRKKMEKARELFSDNNTTVKEVAYMMGYEKVSNFIEIFKKTSPFFTGTIE